MDCVDEINAKLIDFDDLGISEVDKGLMREVQSKLEGRTIRFLPISRGLSGVNKYVIKPETLFPLLAKLGHVDDIRQEYEGDILLRLRLPPLHIPPFFHYSENSDRAILVYRYITGGRVIDIVDRLDVYLGQYTTKGVATIFDEIFDTILKKCHWLDGQFQIKPINLPNIEKPENGIDEAEWLEIEKIYSTTREKAVAIGAPHGITHGDLHPKNILLSRNRSPVLIDFSFAKKDSCIYVDYSKIEVHLQFQLSSEVTDEFERVRNRAYSSDLLLLPRSFSSLALYIYRIRSLLWKNCMSKAVGLLSEQVDLGYRAHLIYFLMRFCSKYGHSKENRKKAFEELKNISKPFMNT